jgi:hypothetical protein
MVHERDLGRPLPGTNAQDKLYKTKTLPPKNAALGRVHLLDNLIVSTSANTQLMGIHFDGDQRRDTFLRQWLQSDRNIFSGPSDGAHIGAFDPEHRKGKPQRQDQLTFTQWQQRVGQDAQGRFVPVDDLRGNDGIPGYADFTSRSPYLQRGLTPQLLSELREFFDFVGIDFEEYRLRNIFQDEFQAEESRF